MDNNGKGKWLKIIIIAGLGLGLMFFGNALIHNGVSQSTYYRK